ncbi:uncharacterized protein [Chironomus tepperi]|uniref:uncharacterized protein n=1 Tax=Chironomus tepperi TaxID=113505 RepID=UPI00391F38D8
MSAAAEPKQVIRALRPRVTLKSLAKASKKSQKIPKLDRSIVDKSWEWKLPPNVYCLSDFTKSLKMMGKRGPYQCFTVERDEKTVKNHHAPKPEHERCETDFYDLPSQIDDGKKPSNFYKNKFSKGQRFADVKDDGIPPPTKYYPQNFSIKLTPCEKKKSVMDNSILYYPHTTVPVRVMEFNKERNTPDPGRYNLHNLSCQCRMAETKDRTIHKIHDEGRPRHRLEMKNVKQTVDDISLPKKSGINREPISFRLKSSASCEDLYPSSIQRDIRFNTMIKKKNLFSTKTGRPVAFLTASPRFEESSEKPIKLYKKKSKKLLSTDKSASDKATTASITKTDIKPKPKGMTKKRLVELATPKTVPLQTTTSDKVQVFTNPPAFSFRYLASNVRPLKKVTGFSDIDIKRLREIVQKEQEEVVGIQEQNIFVSDK